MQMRRLSRPAGSRSWWRGRRGRRATVRSASRRQRVRHPLRDAANFAVDLAATSGPVRTSREHLAGPLRSAVYARVLSAGKGDAIPGALFQLQPVPPQGAGFEVAERAAAVGIKVVDELFARRRLCAPLVGSPGPDVDQAAVDPADLEGDCPRPFGRADHPRPHGRQRSGPARGTLLGQTTPFRRVGGPRIPWEFHCHEKTAE